MNNSAELIVGWTYPVIDIILIVLVSTRPALRGRSFLLAYLFVSLITMIFWRAPPLLLKLELLQPEQVTSIYRGFSLPLNLIGLLGYGCLIPYILAAATFTSNSSGSIGAENAQEAFSADHNHPLYGIKGWLKVLVVVNLYVAPVAFALTQVVAWIGYVILAERYPGIILVGLLSTAVGGWLVVRGIQVAKDLRDIRPRAVQNAKALLKLALGWMLVSIPISFLSGLAPEQLLPGVVKNLIVGGIGFGIWYRYFAVSKRVQATYPDWNT